MSEPKKQNRRGRKPGRVPTRPVMVRLPLPVAEALDALAGRTRRPKNAEIVLALEGRLKEEGLWPPPAAEGEGEE